MTERRRPVDFLVVGMPGSGKSALRSHLVADHGYFDVSFNGEDSIAPEDTLRGGLRQRFTAAFSTGDASRSSRS